jgi:2,4-dienoyl-CoA reductase-like NADH-dependent reductase (Old Yellow Enzyme family)
MTKMFFLPVNTGFFTSGDPNSKALDFYSDRSKHGLYCSIVGNVVVTNGHSTNSSCGVISHNKSWELLANAISNNGAKPGIQLASTWQGYTGQKSFKSSTQNAINYYSDAYKRITNNEVNIFFNNLDFSTKLAISNGFKHIQVHAAHGYLLSLLLDPTFSTMHDHVIKKLIAWNTAIRNQGIETSIRISWESGFDDKLETERQKKISILFKQTFNISY